MEWTKIKAKHFLYTDLSLIDRGVLSTALLLTAHLERIPTTSELARHIPARSLDNLCTKLATLCGTPLAEVLEKVLEDVYTIQHKRALSRKTSHKHRVSAKSDVSPSSSRDTTEKIREDKRRNIYIDIPPYKLVKLKEKEWAALIEKFGETKAREWVKELDDGIAIKGYKYRSHYRAILKWAERKEKENKKKVVNYAQVG